MCGYSFSYRYRYSSLSITGTTTDAYINTRTGQSTRYLELEVDVRLKDAFLGCHSQCLSEDRTRVLQVLLPYLYDAQRSGRGRTGRRTCLEVGPHDPYLREGEGAVWDQFYQLTVDCANAAKIKKRERDH
jgi:hypothetical protein